MLANVHLLMGGHLSKKNRAQPWPPGNSQGHLPGPHSRPERQVPGLPRPSHQSVQDACDWCPGEVIQYGAKVSGGFDVCLFAYKKFFAKQHRDSTKLHHIQNGWTDGQMDV